MNIIMLGPPASGKGTQAKILKEKLNVPHISTGDIFRENIANKTELGIQVDRLIAAGNLVPDDVTNAIVKDRLARPDCAKGFILDGYPRTINQAEFLGKIARIDFVINIDLPDEVLIERMSTRRTCRGCGAIYNIVSMPPKVESVCDKCGGELYQRDDEMPDAIQKRLDTYKEKTEPLLNYYKSKKLLTVVKGHNDKSVVTQRILDIVTPNKKAVAPKKKV